MFVLMDIEWIENRIHHICPTQIAAMRVDEQWHCLDLFYSRIRPRDSSFHQWKHMAYSGASATDFLYANSLCRVLTELQDWLRDDDIICFWFEDSKNILKSVYNLVLKCKVPQRIVILDDYVDPFLSAREMKSGNPYKICANYGLTAEGPKHQSENDVHAMQQALSCINYPAASLYAPPPKAEAAKKPEVAPPPATPCTPDALRPYQFDLNTGLYHKAGCSEIPVNAVLTGHPDLKYFFRKKLTACPHCLKADIRKAIRDRNIDQINRTQYQYLYIDSSRVFHRRGCSAILSTSEAIKGSVYYDGCASTGRRPCKLCCPTPGTWLSATQKHTAKRKTTELKVSIPDRTMNAKEQHAYDRYVQARAERFAAETEEFTSNTEKDDFYTLTQPRFAFFSASGYQTFHKRSCQKLRGLSHITGFSRYKDAIRSGHTPCKFCKPTARLDIDCAIPITNKKRVGESIHDLEVLCHDQGYPYEQDGQFFCFSTPAGKWKIDLSSTPYIVYHINLLHTPHNDWNYHRQPRLFLSLLDTFDYILRHDRKLYDSQGAKYSEPNEATG